MVLVLVNPNNPDGVKRAEEPIVRIFESQMSGCLHLWERSCAETQRDLACLDSVSSVQHIEALSALWGGELVFLRAVSFFSRSIVPQQWAWASDRPTRLTNSWLTSAARKTLADSAGHELMRWVFHTNLLTSNYSFDFRLFYGLFLSHRRVKNLKESRKSEPERDIALRDLTPSLCWTRPHYLDSVRYCWSYRRTNESPYSRNDRRRNTLRTQADLKTQCPLCIKNVCGH